MTDKTLKNLKRDYITLVDHPVDNILPTHFAEDYPALSVFLKKYYDYLDQANTSENVIHDLYNTHDITSMDDDLLQYLEYQFLVGRGNFKGFTNARTVLKTTSSLYRSKGSKFSLEQFFRMFFGVEAEVVYTKENVFIVDDSKIGAESLRYIIDNKLYQTFALLIKTSIAFADWKELYKLFVHPAGMYVGGQVQIVSPAQVIVDPCMPEVLPDEDQDVAVISVASLFSSATPAYNDMTGIVHLDGDSEFRIGLNNTVDLYQQLPIEHMDAQYTDITEVMIATSPTMDNDSDVGEYGTIGMSNTIETMDQDHYLIYDSADQYI